VTESARARESVETRPEVPHRSVVRDARSSLGTFALVFVLFFCTSGGPYTTETLIHKVGPGLGLLILIVVPLVWSIPEVLIVGELASMMPEEGGYYRWVDRAFGRFWAFQNGWLTWMYSLVDMAIYPVLFNQYLKHFVPGLGARFEWAVSLVVIWGATAINLRGSVRVGRASIFAGVFIVAGFVALAIASLPHASHIPWRPFAAPEGGGASGLAVGISIALWNYIGWDNASTVEGEMQDAPRSYPRALAFALPLVVFIYLVPLLTTLAATDWMTWEDGSWPAIAAAAAHGQVGAFLGAWVGVGGMVSALALFNALLMSYSRIPFVMAQDRLLPAPLATADSRGTPRTAVLASAVLYSVFVLAPFGELVIADVLLYSLALFLEFGALVRLRRTQPDLRGPFRIPVGRRGVAVLAGIPMAVMVGVIVISFMDGEYGVKAVLAAGVAIALGPIVFALASRPKRQPA
jgi:amino acid transporter